MNLNEILRVFVTSNKQFSQHLSAIIWPPVNKNKYDTYKKKLEEIQDVTAIGEMKEKKEGKKV